MDHQPSEWLANAWRYSMTKKKNVVVAAMFLAGLLGGATAALASSQAEKGPTETGVSAVRCAIDMCIINGRCRICPEE
jgi:hypothetical protein